jgi:nucleotide-binding universal stress UspA family protein
MLAIRTILHPTDLSPLSECAFRLACSLARDHGARLIVLHVSPLEVLLAESPYVPPPDPAQIWETLQEQLEMLQSPDPTVVVEHLLKEGNPAEEILRTAQDCDCDLIIMGTHGRTGVRRLLMGSVAEHILRRAACPVLTVKMPVAMIESPEKVTAQDVAKTSSGGRQAFG